MKLPIRNRTTSPLTLFIEPYCDQYEIPPLSEAIVILDDGNSHSLDFHPDNWVSLWNEGESVAVVEIISPEQNAVVDALSFVRTWLYQFGPQGKAAAEALENAIESEEQALGYFRARCGAYRAFRQGFRTKALEVEPASDLLAPWAGSETLEAAYLAGGVAAYFNHRTRLEPSLVELGKAPFDTDFARQTFEDADAIVD